MSAQGPGPHLMSADTLVGDKIHNVAGENLGKLESFMIDMDSGKVEYAVLSFGGVMGLGDKFFAVPFDVLKLDTEHHAFELDVEKDRLKNAPGFDKDAWPSSSDQKFHTLVRDFWRRH